MKPKGYRWQNKLSIDRKKKVVNYDDNLNEWAGRVISYVPEDEKSQKIKKIRQNFALILDYYDDLISWCKEGYSVINFTMDRLWNFNFAATNFPL